MTFLAFDWETNGLTNPYPVQFGAVLMDGAQERAAISVMIRPDGWEIPAEVIAIHGITGDIATSSGVPLIVAMALLTHLWEHADLRVAHNLEFDDKVVDGALRRLGRSSAVKRPPGVCTAELATPVLNLPPTAKMLAAGFDKPKRPSLAECYQHFFGEAVPGAHDALADARACARVYMKLTEATQ